MPRKAAIGLFATCFAVSCANPARQSRQLDSTPPATRRAENAGSAPGADIPAHLACRQHSDCSLEPAVPCGCPTCGPERRVAANVAHVAWLEEEYARERCAPSEQACPECPPTTYPVLDELPYCIDGQCELRPRMPAPR